MTDDAWMAGIIAEAEPLDEKPEVRAICFDQYSDTLRLCRTIGATDTDGEPVFAALQRMNKGEARFFSGTGRKGALACAYTCAVWHNNIGERQAKSFIYFGTRGMLDWMTTQAEGILRQYQALMEANNLYPINNPYN
jgi:hypothetical protein